MDFIYSPLKYPAMVAGYACVHPETKVWTEKGLIRICDITYPIRVLSWCEKNRKFVLSLSGGSFPKGKDYLYRISTKQGEFVSTSHHQIFSSACNYKSVDDFALGESFPSASKAHIQSILESCLKEFPLDAPRWKKKDADYLVNYANEARQYGQQLLVAQDSVQVFSPLKGGAHKFLQSSCCGKFSLRWGGQAVRKLKHNHLYQWFSRLCKSHSTHHKQCLFSCEANQISKKPLGHTFASLVKYPQSVLRFFHHHINQLLFFASRSYSSPLINNKIVKVTQEECNIFYDMQVINTNNYICENGIIHHNSGKSEAAIQRLMRLKLEQPKNDVAYYLPTYDLINTIALPRIEEFLINNEIPHTINKNEKMITIPKYGKIILRTMDRPERIVGYETADSILDELDTLPKDKAAEVWRKVIARNRQKKADGSINTVAVATTPEGYKFVYERWHKKATEEYGIIKASTYSNAHNLPADYIETLKNDYPENLLQAYLHGEFVNLSFASVYPEFNRAIHKTNAIVESDDSVIHIGIDFNVGNMSAVLAVVRDEIPHFVDEFTGYLDTPALIAAIRQRYPDKRVMCYPDASGKSRKTVNASESDIALLRQAGFVVLANPSNPFVRDRVLAVNVKFKKNEIFINLDKCQSLVDSLEQQAYDKNGEPDKQSGHDHLCDAIGYYVAYRYPIANKQAVAIKIRGL